jgi:hypothetical protein
MFDTKFAVVVRQDLETWQKLNVTAFLTSGVIAGAPEIIGEPYVDGDGNTYNCLSIQPIIVLATDGDGLTKIHRRALDRGVRLSLYTEDMFETGHDEANRAAVRRCGVDDLNIVGLAFRDDRKVVDKVTKGARMHP